MIINYAYSDDALRHLLSFDSDPVNRWEAGQRLALTLLLQGIADYQAARELRFPDVPGRCLWARSGRRANDPAFAAEALALPLEVYVAEQLAVIDPDAVHQVRLAMRRFLAERLKTRAAENLRRLCRCRELQSRCRIGGSAGPAEPVPRLPDGIG